MLKQSQVTVGRESMGRHECHLVSRGGFDSLVILDELRSHQWFDNLHGLDHVFLVIRFCWCCLQSQLPKQ